MSETPLSEQLAECFHEGTQTYVVGMALGIEIDRRLRTCDPAPVTPSREAEIAAATELSDDTLTIWAQGKFIDDTSAKLASQLLNCRAQLQQARQEADEAKASEQRQYDQSVEATVEMLQLRAALQQAREALTKFGRHNPPCAARYGMGGEDCTCGLDAALQAVR